MTAHRRLVAQSAMKILNREIRPLALAVAALALNLCGVPQARAASFLTNSPMLSARLFHTATLLRNGKVLVAGGTSDLPFLNSNQASAELYDPATRTWTATGTMNHPRAWHTATLLPDGKVLVVGGVASLATNLFAAVAAELYDPATGKWVETGAPKSAYGYVATTLLPNGKVLVAGDPDPHSGVGLCAAEVFDPASGIWTATTAFKTSCQYPTSTLLRNGQVLLSGGFNFFFSGLAWGRDYDGKVTVRLPPENIRRPNDAQIYNPASGIWTSVKNSGGMSASSPHTATLLPDGKVLFVGVEMLNSPPSGAFIYDPAGGTWTATSAMTSPRNFHTATLLADGKVLVVGGGVLSQFPNPPIGNPTPRAILSSAELYDPASGKWTELDSHLDCARAEHTATLLPDGRVLITGGCDSDYSVTSSTEIFDPEYQKDDGKTSPMR
jgi:hypothetical protein